MIDKIEKIMSKHIRKYAEICHISQFCAGETGLLTKTANGIMLCLQVLERWGTKSAAALPAQDLKGRCHMKKLYRVLALVFTAAMLLSFAACSQSESPPSRAPVESS